MAAPFKRYRCSYCGQEYDEADGWPDDGIAPDFVGMGVEMMKFRQIKALPLVTSPATEAEVEKVVLAWLRRLQPGDEASLQARALAALGWTQGAWDAAMAVEASSTPADRYRVDVLAQLGRRWEAP